METSLTAIIITLNLLGYNTDELLNIHENNHQSTGSFSNSNEGLIVRVGSSFILLPHPVPNMKNQLDVLINCASDNHETA